MKYSTFVLAWLLLFSFQATAFEQFKEFKRDQWDFELGTDYFASEANYGSGGSQQNLISGSSYSLTNFSLGTRYSPARNWSVFALGNIGMSVSKNSIATRTNTSFNQILAGADFLMYSGWLDAVPEFALLVPLEKVDSTADSSLNSEGVVEGRGRITLQKSFGRTRGYGYLGMTFRDGGRSFLVPWGVGASLRSGAVTWGAELFGSQSISDDTDKKNETARNAYLNTVNAGSFAFYSVNPSIIDTQASFLWQMSSRWSVKGQGGLTLAGANEATGYHVGAFLRYSFDMTEGYVQEPEYVPMESAVPSGRSNLYFDSTPDREIRSGGFQEDTNDGVDQKIFNVRPKTPGSGVKTKLQKQMDATEFDIELKSKKRKNKR